MRDECIHGIRQLNHKSFIRFVQFVSHEVKDNLLSCLTRTESEDPGTAYVISKDGRGFVGGSPIDGDFLRGRIRKADSNDSFGQIVVALKYHHVTHAQRGLRIVIDNRYLAL